MALITLSSITTPKQNKDGASVISPNPKVFSAGDINATFISFIEGLFKSAGFSNSSNIEVDDTTKKWSNVELATRLLNQISGNFYTATGTDAYSLVPPASNTNLFPNALVSGRSVFMFLTPSTNTNSNLTLNIPTVTTNPLKIFKSDGATLFSIGEFELNSIAICFYDETLDSGNGGFKTVLTIDKAQFFNTFAPINSANLTGTPTAPTPAISDNSTKIATTEYTNNLINQKFTSGTFTMPDVNATTIGGVGSFVKTPNYIEVHFISNSFTITIAPQQQFIFPIPNNIFSGNPSWGIASILNAGNVNCDFKVGFDASISNILAIRATKDTASVVDSKVSILAKQFL